MALGTSPFRFQGPVAGHRRRTGFVTPHDDPVELPIRGAPAGGAQVAGNRTGAEVVRQSARVGRNARRSPPELHPIFQGFDDSLGESFPNVDGQTGGLGVLGAVRTHRTLLV